MTVQSTAVSLAERIAPEVTGRIERLVETANDLEITDNESRQISADMIADVKAVENEIAAAKDSILKPLRETQARVNALFDEPLRQVGVAVTTIKDKIKTHFITARHAGNEPPKTFRGMDRGTVTLKRKRGHRVTDSSLIPREYLKVDTTAINRAINASDGEVVIPGIEVVRGDVTVSVRV